MKMSTLIMIVFSALLMIISYKNSFAYDNKYTHRYINEIATEKSNIDNKLKKLLGFKSGIDEEIKGKKILMWISEGGFEEDEPALRCLRHFHNPIKPWDEAGLLSIYKPLAYWAQQSEPDNQMGRYNEYSWQFARTYYHQALLTESDKQYAKMFRALGQLMHLVSDAAVPAHVRNDPHIPYIFDADPYENWVKAKFTASEKDTAPIPIFDYIVDPAIFDLAISDASAPSPISALCDHDEYLPDGSNLPDGLNRVIGLAEYTNANFWTVDSKDDFPHPKLDETNYDEDIWLDPEPIDAEDGEVDRRIYFSKHSGDPVTHFASAGYWYYQLERYNALEVRHAFILDERCHQDYAEKLIPRTIGYSAALLDYFFRGQLEVTAYPYFENNALGCVRLVLTNTTESQEALANGEFSLVFKYTPVNGNPDGSDDIMVPAAQIVPCDQLLYDDSIDVFFSASQTIPIECWDSVTCTLAYRGTLGVENGAVIGKVFNPGKILFNEEWDNGLTGNHDWITTPEDANADNGTSSITVTSDSLIMENYRKDNSGVGRSNEVLLDLTADGSDGLVITPTTCVQFLIPEMYATTTKTRYITHTMMLVFDDYYTLQYTADGPLFHWNDKTIYLSFTPGLIYTDNIIDIFKNASMPIPDTLHLKYISFLQLAYEWEGEYIFYMDVDAVRIIDIERRE